MKQINLKQIIDLTLIAGRSYDSSEYFFIIHYTRPICCCLLFNDSHVLQLWSETVAVRRLMIYGFG